MIKFSANLSMLFNEVPLLERFEKAAKAGFKYVEIQFPYELPANQIANQLEQWNLDLDLFNVPAGDLMTGGEGLASVPGEEQAFEQALDVAVQYAEILQPRAMNVLAGRCSDPSRQAEYQQVFISNLKKAADRFEKLHVLCVFEAINHFDMPGFWLSRSHQQREIIALLQHRNIAAQVDLYHAAKMQEDPVAVLQQMQDKLGHIQFADCPGRHEPGTGCLEWHLILETINNLSYQGCLAAEYVPVGRTESGFQWLTDQVSY